MKYKDAVAYLAKYLPGSYLKVEKESTFTLVNQKSWCTKKYVFLECFDLENKDKIYTIIHSIKLFKFLRSIKIIPVTGVPNEKNVFFFPKLSHKENGLHNLKGNKKILKSAISLIPKSLQDIFSKIYLSLDISSVDESWSKLHHYEIALIRHEFIRKKVSSYPLTSNYMLPFDLTIKQIRAWNIIEKELCDEYKMKLLLHGDVGAGKTVVGWLAAQKTYVNGKRVFVLVPSLTLVNQIYSYYEKWFTLNNQFPKIVKVIGSEKIIDYENIDILIGTQALLYRKIGSCGLLIIDEQQRFGVSQRQKISCENYMMMTATPIPRTLSMALKGLITQVELPKTHAVHQKKIYHILPINIDLVIKKISKLIKCQKVFWVGSRIKDLEDIQEMFKDQKNITLVHSKIPNYVKMIANFCNQSNGLLLSTTVIEVGLDSDVNYLIISGVESFGISQLYQIMGRVGRKAPATVIIISLSKRIPNILRKYDCFDVSKMDLKKRGGSIVTSNAQSGFRDLIFNRHVQSNGKVVQSEIEIHISKLPNLSHELIIFLRLFISYI